MTPPRQIAWPTVLLAVACVCLTSAAVALQALPLGAGYRALAFVMATAACFAGFTPIHESAHHNIAPDRRANDLVGRLCAPLLLGALGPYRWLHGQHHQQPNRPGSDPDLYGATGPGWALPIRWFTQDVGYLMFWLRSRRPRAERVELFGFGAAYVAVGLAAAAAGPQGVMALLLGWWLPARLALGLLAVTFAWWPHAPHRPGEPGRTTVDHPLAAVLLLGQNHHGLHHRHPGVPFYRLAAWKRPVDGISPPGRTAQGPGRRPPAPAAP